MEWNPNSADLSANIYKKAAREEIQNQIKERYKDNPVLQKVMSGLQEIISNRGDSIVNGLVFGNFFGGIANQYLQEFLSAVPMGVAAATDAVSEAKEKGASDTQLLGIYATTLLFEAGTEAVSLDNIRESLDLGKELTVDGLKDWAKEWLTKSGISEMIGETITEAVEQAADTYFLGENSDYAKAVEQYKADGMSEDAAKQQASLDQVGNLLHTALISYLSPGMDIASYAAGRYSGYKSEARYRQEHGNNVSVMDVYKEYKQRKSGEQPSQTQAQTAEIEANNSAPDIEGTYGQENAIPESPTAPENPVEVTIPETSKPKYDTAAQALTLDIEILESANNGDPSVQTASIAAVLNTGRTDESFDVSNAAAVNMSELFGDVTPSEGIQNLMLGAHVTDVDVDMVKHAIETAALSKNSDAYKIMQTEEYQNADPGERAEMLADTVDNDMNNQVVVNDISKAVYENRVAQAENKVLDMPEVKQAYGKAYDAQGKLLAAQDATEQAQTQLDGYESELDAKRDALRTAGDELSNDASDAARVDMVSHAIADLQKTSEVVEEYKQHLTKMQKAETEAQELADRTLEEYANTKRTFAERLVNEENQQRSETKAQQDVQAAVDQAKAQQQAEQEAAQAQAQEETDNADYADREAFVDKIAAENPDMTEEDKQTVRDMYDQEVAARNESNPVTEPARDENGILTTQAKKNRDKFVQGVSKKFGIQVDFMDTSEGGTKVKANGYYDAANNRIVLDQNATMDEAMYAVLGHELTHVAEKSETYTSLANSILRIAYGDDADYEAAVNNLNRNNGKPTTKLEANIVYLKTNVYKPWP